MSNHPPEDTSWIVAVEWENHVPYDMEYLSLDCNQDLYASPDCDLHWYDLSIVIWPEDGDQSEEDDVEIVL